MSPSRSTPSVSRQDHADRNPKQPRRRTSSLSLPNYLLASVTLLIGYLTSHSGPVSLLPAVDATPIMKEDGILESNGTWHREQASAIDLTGSCGLGSVSYALNDQHEYIDDNGQV